MIGCFAAREHCPDHLQSANKTTARQPCLCHWILPSRSGRGLTERIRLLLGHVECPCLHVYLAHSAEGKAPGSFPKVMVRPREVIALVACSVMWKSTPILLFCTVLAGSVGVASCARYHILGIAALRPGCMSSVTYWAAVAQRPASCVRGMSASTARALSLARSLCLSLSLFLLSPYL